MEQTLTFEEICVALRDGKTIEFFNHKKNSWNKMEFSKLSTILYIETFANQLYYRIKPETKEPEPEKYHYDINCIFHSPNHFELVIHCSDCTPKEPECTEILVRTKNLKKLTNKTG